MTRRRNWLSGRLPMHGGISRNLAYRSGIFSPRSKLKDLRPSQSALICTRQNYRRSVTSISISMDDVKSHKFIYGTSVEMEMRWRVDVNVRFAPPYRSFAPPVRDPESCRSATAHLSPRWGGKRTGRFRKPLGESFASSGQGFGWKTPSFLPFITFTSVVASGHLT